MGNKGTKIGAAKLLSTSSSPERQGINAMTPDAGTDLKTQAQSGFHWSNRP